MFDKQPGIIVHPTKGHRDGTIANAIIFYMEKRGENYKPRFISRLDMGTSGVLIVGKNSHAQDNLAKQSEAGSFEKVYFAILEGNIEDDLPRSGIIDLPIGRASLGDPRREVLPETKGGYPSKTEYEIVATLPGETAVCEHHDIISRADSCLTVVRVRLITGRTHQIRVHFSHFGHPVLGDHLYGSQSPLIGRQALHAFETSFAHPGNGRKMRFIAPFPRDISDIFGEDFNLKENLTK